jgi:hypothetical protein
LTRATASITYIQELLGHSSVTTTEQYCARRQPRQRGKNRFAKLAELRDGDVIPNLIAHAELASVGKEVENGPGNQQVAGT